MTTRNSNTNSLFMADFASTDRRSAKAHIEGKSLRVKVFTAFTTVAKLVGRGATAADDFKVASRFFFKRREAIGRFGKNAGRVATAVVGLAAGVGLFFFLVQ